MSEQTTLQQATAEEVQIAGPGSKLKIVRLKLRSNARSVLAIRSHSLKMSLPKPSNRPKVVKQIP